MDHNSIRNPYKRISSLKISFSSHKILKLAEKMKWEETIIDGSSKVQNYLLNAIMVIEKKNSLRNDFI